MPPVIVKVLKERIDLSDLEKLDFNPGPIECLNGEYELLDLQVAKKESGSVQNNDEIMKEERK